MHLRPQRTDRTSRSIDQLIARVRPRRAQQREQAARRTLVTVAIAAGGAGALAGWMTRRFEVGGRAVAVGRRGVQRAQHGIGAVGHGAVNAGRTVTTRTRELGHNLGQKIRSNGQTEEDAPAANHESALST